MTLLTPERLSTLRRAKGRFEFARELFGHIDALEAKLAEAEKTITQRNHELHMQSLRTDEQYRRAEAAEARCDSFEERFLTEEATRKTERLRFEQAEKELTEKIREMHRFICEGHLYDCECDYCETYEDR